MRNIIKIHRIIQISNKKMLKNIASAVLVSTAFIMDGFTSPADNQNAALSRQKHRAGGRRRKSSLSTPSDVFAPQRKIVSEISLSKHYRFADKNGDAISLDQPPKTRSYASAARSTRVLRNFDYAKFLGDRRLLNLSKIKSPAQNPLRQI
ncbi:hypothetical protein CAMRE0001_0885 [Campylobacter rectus RM3267]|uniref:Uncharacterized protein n=2 Tax=Campylobacter rectus TaxID=203 RepID=B9D209_CAMRE|nr:hypothetical protein CAMRE0001_0885 [Campylobacter rectus RM3267]